MERGMLDNDKQGDNAMLTIGAHVSIAKGFAQMGKTALTMGANTLAFFTRNPRGGAAKAMDPADVEAFSSITKANHFGPLVAHASYTMNAAAAKPETRRYAKEAFTGDLKRMAHLPGNLYNFHPGSHVGQGARQGIAYVAGMLNDTLTREVETTVLLETMSGKGTEIGGTFEELAAILQAVALPEKMGVCLDTCHVWDGGYDIADDLDGVLTRFDKTIGLKKLKAIHLNDSMNGLGSRKDRHARIGEGSIGLAAFERIINHPALHALPFILETPNDVEGWAKEICLLRGAYHA